MQETIFKHAIKTAITLVAFAFVGTAMLAYVFDITRAPIEASEKEARLALFKELSLRSYISLQDKYSYRWH